MKTLLKPGMTYRRMDFVGCSSNVDRNLATLVKSGLLKKLQHGLYTSPKTTEFGESLPNENSLISAFLNDDHFVVYSASAFNSLELGSTQLYNKQVVFNRKRHGVYTLGQRTYFFNRWREAPKKLSKEFLLIEFVNRLSDLMEDSKQIMKNLKLKINTFDRKKLLDSLDRYGLKATQKKLRTFLN